MFILLFILETQCENQLSEFLLFMEQIEKMEKKEEKTTLVEVENQLILIKL